MEKIKFQTEEDKEIERFCKENKLSVSNIKFSKGHDMDCINANLKIGNKIVGRVFDDSYGGCLQYFDHKEPNSVDSFIQIIETKVKEMKEKYPYINIDTFVNFLIYYYDDLKKCKNNILIRFSKDKNIEDFHTPIYNFQIKLKYNNTKTQEKQILDLFKDKDFKYYEIINEKYQ